MQRRADDRPSPLWLAAGTGLVGVCLGAAAVMLGGQAARQTRETPPAPATAPVEPTVVVARPAVEPAPAPAAPDLRDAIARTRDAVVNIGAHGTLGAGVIVHSRGIVLTNYHVIADALEGPPGGRSGHEESPTVVARFENGRELPATVLVADSNEDLAILRLQPPHEESFAAVSLGRSSALRVGQEVFAIGNPFGLNHSISRGIVSALDRTEVMRQLPLIQLDASINLGNSGGPLFALDGSLVGIVTLRRKDAEGIAFAVPVDHVRGFLDTVRDPDAPHRSGAIGVEIEPVVRGLDGDPHGYGDGLRVIAVVPGGTAEAAGLRPGDLIVEIRGKRLDGLPEPRSPAVLVEHLVSTVRSLFPGERLALSVLRDGVRVPVEVEIGAAPSDQQVGIDAEDLLGLRLQLASGPPVVKGVVAGSRSSLLRPLPLGMEIVSVVDEPIDSVEDLGTELAELRELMRKNQGPFWVRVGLRDPADGITRHYLVLLQ